MEIAVSITYLRSLDQRAWPKAMTFLGSREVADLASETSSSGLSREKDSPPQGPLTAVSCSRSSS
ncbi:hypothetical protein E2C01_048821 [Portunus trituberculatus]|uniref:Uncharacterized protein n=1 Tax=Portunus trituberculatus TaxID=210409 RepID=A0A5B7G7F6_PORTR|nr:hypothetical protein [Portunus trituberculatus]